MIKSQSICASQVYAKVLTVKADWLVLTSCFPKRSIVFDPDCIFSGTTLMLMKNTSILNMNFFPNCIHCKVPHYYSTCMLLEFKYLLRYGTREVAQGLVMPNISWSIASCNTKLALLDRFLDIQVLEWSECHWKWSSAFWELLGWS